MALQVANSRPDVVLESLSLSLGEARSRWEHG
jgi:hypothetical protein